MRREIFVHLAFLISFFLLISVFRGWLSLSYWPFWLGGLVGTFLPDVDHFIYVYFLKPQEHTSQRTSYMMQKRDVRGAVSLLSDTHKDRETLVLHTVLFQLIFLILTFLVVTSSGSMFGRGLVLSFSLHFLVDQAKDFREGNWNRWLHQLPFVFNKRQLNLFWWTVLVILLIFGFLM